MDDEWLLRHFLAGSWRVHVCYAWLVERVDLHEDKTCHWPLDHIHASINGKYVDERVKLDIRNKICVDKRDYLSLKILHGSRLLTCSISQTSAQDATRQTIYRGKHAEHHDGGYEKQSGERKIHPLSCLLHHQVCTPPVLCITMDHQKKVQGFELDATKSTGILNFIFWPGLAVDCS